VWPESGSRIPEPDFDGVTIQWFASADDFWAHVREPDQGEMMADAANFLDVASLHWTICEDAVVMIGEEAGASTEPVAMRHD
jgi:hypothetical protein